MMAQELVYAPLLDPALLVVLGTVLAAMVGIALWRGLSGWWLRGLGAAVALVPMPSVLGRTAPRRGAVEPEPG